MLSAQLKAYTGEAHASLEKKIIQKIKTISSRQDYYNILSLFYGYYHELEVRIDSFLDTAFLPDYQRRRKADVMARDMASLPETAGEAVLCRELPAIGTHLQAVGVLYVLEGSTLGGQAISSMISKQINISGDGLSFFTGYGAETPRMWALFIDQINCLKLSIPERHEVLDAAHHTFTKFESWVIEYDNQQKLRF